MDEQVADWAPREMGAKSRDCARIVDSELGPCSNPVHPVQPSCRLIGAAGVAAAQGGLDVRWLCGRRPAAWWREKAPMSSHRG